MSSACPLQSKRQTGIDLIQWNGLLIQDAVYCAANAFVDTLPLALNVLSLAVSSLALERMVAGQHFVQNRPKGKNVRPLINLRVGKLFGRHIPRRSDQLADSKACKGESYCGRVFSGRFRRWRLDQFGETKIEDF